MVYYCTIFFYLFRMSSYLLEKKKKVALDLIYFFKVTNLTSTSQIRNTQEKSDMLPEKANSSKNMLKHNSDIEPEQPIVALKFLLLLLSAVAWKEISR